MFGQPGLQEMRTGVSLLSGLMGVVATTLTALRNAQKFDVKAEMFRSAAGQYRQVSLPCKWTHGSCLGVFQGRSVYLISPLIARILATKLEQRIRLVMMVQRKGGRARVRREPQKSILWFIVHF